MDVSRRSLAKALIASAALPVEAEPQAATDEETRSAHEALRNNAEQIAKVDLKMSVEPAFHFKA